MIKEGYLSLQELLRRAGGGDTKAFELLYRNSFSSAYKVAKYITHSDYYAEDVVADVFTALWKEREKLLTIQNWESYLFLCIRNQSLYLLKKVNKYQNIADTLPYHLYIDEGESPLDAVERGELEIKLRGVIDGLPERMKLVFYLSKEQGLSAKDIANHLKTSVRTVETQLYEATRRIKEQIEAYLSL